MIIGNKEFDITNHTYLMGILNVTPDSFSDGGKFVGIDSALYRVEEMIHQGADIIDVGGESTRPGYEQISVNAEIERVVPVIEEIKKRFDIPVSLDTYKSDVAKEGIRVGADLINDIWGLQYDAKMAQVIAEDNVACCLMHNRREAIYDNYIEEVIMDLQASINKALDAQISKEKIIVDPGVGFGKTYEHNLEVIRRIKELEVLECPVLLGVSRKSVIGLTLNVPTAERLNGTLALSAYAFWQGCSFLRVHDIKENKEVIKMLEAIGVKSTAKSISR